MARLNAEQRVVRSVTTLLSAIIEASGDREEVAAARKLRAKLKAKGKQ